MIAVEKGLYIGSVSDLKDDQILKDAGITHILTVDSEEPALTGFHTKFVRALDDASTDLLSKLNDCISFVAEARSERSAVLVHWYVSCFGDTFIVNMFIK